MKSNLNYQYSNTEYTLTNQQDLRATLIVGWNVEAASLYDRILSAPALGYNIIGFIKPHGEIGKSHYKNVPVLGDLGTLKEVIFNHKVEEILIVLSEREKPYLGDIVKICTQNAVSYKVVSDTYDAAYSHLVRDIIKDALSPSDIGLRRIFDILISLFLLFFLFPLFIVTAIAIKLESSGPVFYKQPRYGKDKKIFSVYKFRSMVQNAEKKSGPVWASKEDPRITRVGKFMRKTRIDELPQLLNVLLGEMSFIGPRPERPFFADTFKKQIPFYMNRLKTKPGITGLAQVTVGYDETLDDVKAKVARDIEYIEHKNSLKMNLHILWKTINVVIAGEGQ